MCTWRSWWRKCIGCKVHGRCARTGMWLIYLRLVYNVSSLSKGANLTHQYLLNRSVHNIWIEPLWVDWTSGVGAKWKTFFQGLEIHHGLDSENPAHIWLLHHLFLHIINHEAMEWVNSWNSHVVCYSPTLETTHLTDLTSNYEEILYENSLISCPSPFHKHMFTS